MVCHRRFRAAWRKEIFETDAVVGNGSQEAIHAVSWTEVTKDSKD